MNNIFFSFGRTIHAFFLLLSVVIISAQPASAGPKIDSDSDRSACVIDMMNKQKNFFQVRELEGKGIGVIPSCNFDEFSLIKILHNKLTSVKAIETKTSASPKLKFAKADSILNDRANHDGSVVVTVDILNARLEVAARQLLEKSVTQPNSQAYARYLESVIKYTGAIDPTSLQSNYENYDVVAREEKAFLLNFNPRSQLEPTDEENLFDYAFIREGEISECKQTCRDYIELFVLSSVAGDYWALNSLVKINQVLAKIEASLAKYENYLFETGDGLYPWEIWLNSQWKTNNIFEVPDRKYNLLHPSPIVYYNDKAGEIDPSILVELVGVTWLNYEGGRTDRSLPVGGALVADFEDDRVRFGVMAHLPLKGLLYRSGLGFVADIMPCELCSLTFVTDGDDDWSVGFKVDVAQLLYPKTLAKVAYRKQMAKKKDKPKSTNTTERAGN